MPIILKTLNNKYLFVQGGVKMKSKKFIDLNLDNVDDPGEIFSGEYDEEVMNCEGGPCNFILKHYDE
jgi:hypothetical protein